MPKIQFDAFFKRICDTTIITSQTSLAKSLNISRSAITQAKINNSIPQKWILKLSHLYNINPVWVEKGNGPRFTNLNNYQNIFIQIPKIRARLSAGSGSFETEPELEEYYSFRNDWLSKKGKAKDMILMDVTGNSMEPELKEGDTVLINQSQTVVLAGAIYAVSLEEAIVVKRAEKRPKEIILYSANRDYPPMSFRNEEMNSVRIIGKVIWICREVN